MSESKVPLPECIRYCWGRKIPLENGGYQQDAGVPIFDEKAMRSYGDARAAEARRLALMEAIDLAENFHDYTRSLVIEKLRGRLRALADEANPPSASTAPTSAPASPQPHLPPSPAP